MGAGRVVAALAATTLSLGGCSALPFMPVVVTVTPPPLPPPATVAAAPTPAPSTPAPVATPFVSGARAWTAVAERVSPALVRIEVAGCDTRVVGSGFFVDDDLVVTAAHVVTGASALSVQYAGGVVPALVVGIDRTSDTAVIRTARPVAPKKLSLAAAASPSGADVGFLGFPSGSFNLSAAEGTVNGAASVDYGSIKASSALSTDATVTDGVTGGPVVDGSGAVVGIVTGPALWVSGLDTSVDERKAKLAALGKGDDGARSARAGGFANPTRERSPGLVVPAPQVAEDVKRWRDAPNRDVLDCYGDAAPALDDPQPPTVEVRSGHAYARDVAAAIALHGQAINTGGHEVAFGVFTPWRQERLGGLESWRSEQAGTHWDRITVTRLIGTGNIVEARVELRTTQDAAHGYRGQTCSIRQQDYTMRTSGGGWLIQTVTNTEPPAPC